MGNGVIALTQVAETAVQAPEATLDELAGSGDVLALVPHPDDESLAMGGAIAAASVSGRRVHVVVVTDGARSHPHSDSHPPPILSRLRRTEVNVAVSVLTGRSRRPIWLGYPDMAAPECPGDYEEISGYLAGMLAGVTAIWTTWDGDPHPDHQRVWRLGRWLADRHAIPRLFSCPVWGRVQTPVVGASSRGLRRFPTRDYQFVKSTAVAAHASQMTDLISDDPTGFRMSAELAAYFVEADEIFIPA